MVTLVFVMYTTFTLVATFSGSIDIITSKLISNIAKVLTCACAAIPTTRTTFVISNNTILMMMCIICILHRTTNANIYTSL